MDGIYSLEPGVVLPAHDHLFQLGVHMGDPVKGEPVWYPHLNKKDWRAQYLGDIAADALGFTGNSELRPSLSFTDEGRPVEDKYIVLGIHSTAQAKYWNNPTGWQEIVDWHKQKGYRVFIASQEADGYMGNQHPTGTEEMPKDLQSVSNWIRHAEYFIGLSSGLSWLAWAVGAKIVLISGFTPEECEFKDNTLRIIDKSVCNSCWKWGHFDRGDWNWCPAHKGTEKQFECTKRITGASVIKQIEEWKK
jgi:autotransporter strand-loop-strand O-heptosyltransferase